MDMQTTYNVLNDRFFDSELPNADILLFDDLDPVSYVILGIDFAIDGICIPEKKNWIIGIGNSLTREQRITVLVHEMIHVWQGENQLKMNHGKAFKDKCQQILEAI